MTEATEVQEQLEQIRENSVMFNMIEGFDESFTEFTREVVEDGSMVPDSNITGDLILTLRQRITGEREQDFSAMVSLGIMIGSALERDVPKDSEEEEQWRNGEFEL